jgi:hypothetical protein
MKPLPKDEQNALASNADTVDLILWLAYKEAKAMLKFEATRKERMSPTNRRNRTSTRCAATRVGSIHSSVIFATRRVDNQAGRMY